MHLWQLDLMGGVPLADGRKCKLVTGIDDHSRFVMIAAVVAVPSGRAGGVRGVHRGDAPLRVPFEVLTDNDKQFTGRHTRPQPVEVLFERVCRENGVTQRLTKPRSPTTTGKIERWHGMLRRDLLDHMAPFESAQVLEAIAELGTRKAEWPAIPTEMTRPGVWEFVLNKVIDPYEEAADRREEREQRAQNPYGCSMPPIDVDFEPARIPPPAAVAARLWIEPNST